MEEQQVRSKPFLDLPPSSVAVDGPSRLGPTTPMPATLLLALSATAANGPAPTSAPFPYAPSTYPKVQLQLDPMAYRSASQGPVMPKELQPATKSDYDEIDVRD